MSEHESQAKGGQVEDVVRPRLTKEGLLAYFRQFLGGDRGDASAEVLADLCLNVQHKTERHTRAALQAAHGAILEAITSEDGLDGSDGERVLRLIEQAIAV